MLISPVQPWVAEHTGLKERISPESLKNWQLKMVRKTIEYAVINSVFYKKRLQGIDVAKILSIEDMQTIPFTFPEDILQDSKSLLCVSSSAVARITSLSTSGSTGNPKRIYFTDNDLERTIDFFACGMSSIVQKGRSTLICLSSQTENSIGDLLQKGLTRIGVSSMIHGNIKDVFAALKIARDFECFVGLPEEMFCLCMTDESLRPKSVLLSADFVPESIIKAIEEKWHCKVFTHYGMTETGFGGGVQCEARLGYHLRDADLLVEIVDNITGKQLPAGEVGEVVITTLQNEAMPLIRYRTGDIARIITESCPCGGSLPRLDKVIGRFANNMLLENGTKVSIHDLDEVMFGIDGLKNYSVKLTGKNILHFLIDCQAECNRRLLTEIILRNNLLENIEIKIEYGNVASCLGRGKRRIIIE